MSLGIFLGWATGKSTLRTRVPRAFLDRVAARTIERRETGTKVKGRAQRTGGERRKDQNRMRPGLGGGRGGRGELEGGRNHLPAYVMLRGYWTRAIRENRSLENGKQLSAGVEEVGSREPPRHTPGTCVFVIRKREPKKNWGFHTWQGGSGWFSDFSTL